MKSKINFKIVYLILLVIVLLVFIYYNYQKNRKENYLTYFIPYYNIKYDKFPDYRNYKYPEISNLRIGHIDEDKKYSDFISKMFIGSTNILKVTNIRNEYENQIIDGLINNEIDIGFVSISNLKQYMKHSDYDKIRYISYSYNNYLYIICRADIKFKKIDELFDYRVSIGKNKGKTNTFCKFVFKKLFGERFNTINYIEDDEDIAFNKLKNNEIDIICYFSPFPSKKVKDWLDNSLLKLFYIHPMELSSFQKKIMYQEDKIFNEGYINLNKVSKKYLPIYVDKELYYTKYKPILKTISSYDIIICRRDLPDYVTYNLAAILYYNFELIKQKLGSSMAPNQRLLQYSYIGTTQIHPGAYTFINKIGFVKTLNNKCYNNSKLIPCNESIDTIRNLNQIIPFTRN